MRKALLVVTVAMCALLWMSHGEPAYAKTIACQGHDTFTFDPGFTVSNSAIWSVTVVNSKFTGGFLIATYGYGYPAVSCFYELGAGESEFESWGGFTEQSLVWFLVYAPDSVPCSDVFEDDVFLISNSTASVMNDDNLDDDGSPGSGTCVVI